MLGERRRGLGGRVIAAITSVLAGWVFGSTAWGQSASLAPGARVVMVILLALTGAGLVWLVYGLLVLVRHLFRKLAGRP